MSESYINSDILGKHIPLNITSTIDKYQVGNFLSPSFGGGTANVEFEVLTSLNVFLNKDELIYTSNLNESIYSLPYYLNTLGYNTTAMHNAEKDFYNRHLVYPKMGFNHFLSIWDMAHREERNKYFRGHWASDSLIYDNIKRILNESEQPQFIYAVTVENHFNYDDDRFGKNNFDLDLLNLTNESKQILNTYLSGLKSADLFFKDLVKTLEKIDRPTIVIFFGDHLPNLTTAYDEINFYSSAEEKLRRNNIKFYQTPLSVWSNFTIDQSQFADEVIPASFLAPKVLKAANLHLPPYYQFINNINSCFKYIHKVNTVDKRCSQDSKKLYEDYMKVNNDTIKGKNFTFRIVN